MKNKRLSIALLSAGVLLSIASCGPQTPTDSSSSEDTSTPGSSSSSKPAGEVTIDLTNKDLKRGQTTFTNAKGETKQLNRSQLYKNAGNPHIDSYPTTGVKQKLLLAPLKFKEPTENDNRYITPTTELLEKIELVFTGKNEKTKSLTDGVDKTLKEQGGNISLEEFYEKSSFGHGAFEVVMIPTWIPYQIDGKDATAKEFYAKSGGQGGVYASDYVKNWVKGELSKANNGALGADWKYTLDDLDSDDDGFIDLVWNVYSYRQNYNSDNDYDAGFWWAYVTYTGQQTGSKTNPNVQTIAWASTDFMNEHNNGYDSRTFIHETGHGLGLDDYYDYNNTWAPAAAIDYMDHNLGDHNSYSKFSLGWVNPWILTEDELKGGKHAEITLRLATTSGDCLVLASPDYNGTAFDEYLMVELVGPYGLCDEYKETGILGSSTKGFTDAGIRVWHVDSRGVANGQTPINNPVFANANEVGQKATELWNDNSCFGRGGGDNQFADRWYRELGLSNEELAKPHTPANGTVEKSYAQLSIVEYTVNENTNPMNTKSYIASNASLYKRNNEFGLVGKSGFEKRANVFMPSGSNLWNKAKTITGGSRITKQQISVDTSKTCNYTFKVKSIETGEDGYPVAKLVVSLMK